MARSYSPLEPKPAPVVERRGIVRVEADGLGVVGDGPVVLPLGRPGPAPVDERSGLVRVESDDLAVVGHGLVRLALLLPDQAPPVVSGGVGRVGPDLLGIEVDGPVERDDLAGRDPAADRAGDQPQPAAVGTLDRVDPERAPVVHDPLADPQRRRVLRDDPRADRGESSCPRGRRRSSAGPPG